MRDFLLNYVIKFTGIYSRQIVICFVLLSGSPLMKTSDVFEKKKLEHAV